MIDINLLLSWGAAYKKLKAGEFIFTEGSVCNFYHQLIYGKIRWVNTDEDQNEYLQSLIDPGESFGEIPLFDNGAYAASAVAEEDSLIIRLHKTSFLEILKENPDIQMSFIQLLAKRIRYKFMILKSIALFSPEERIIALLKYLKKENKSFNSANNKVLLTRQQIANITGLRVETVIRTMKLMHRSGDITIRGGKVYLEND